jgi:hypothetical protein
MKLFDLDIWMQLNIIFYLFISYATLLIWLKIRFLLLEIVYQWKRFCFGYVCGTVILLEGNLIAKNFTVLFARNRSPTKMTLSDLDICRHCIRLSIFVYFNSCATLPIFIFFFATPIIWFLLPEIVYQRKRLCFGYVQRMYSSVPYFFT